MFIFVARTKDPERKPALLREILDYVLDKPLSAVTFRTLADGLAVSTYTLVYHFGTRAALVREIVQAVAERQAVDDASMAAGVGGIDLHLDNIRQSWQLSLSERGLQLRRLEFEAAMLESWELVAERITRTTFARWNNHGIDALTAIGLSRDDAEVEARVIVNTMYGLHYDLIVTRDAARATTAFERARGHYEERIRALAGR
jgi:AcrR family transcriptional regulator